MSKVVTMEQAIARLKDGMTIAIGGFAGVGDPLKCIDAIVASGAKDLTLISVVTCNPFAGKEFDLAPLFENQQISKYITAHTGTCPTCMEQAQRGELEIEYVPMGSWIERLRAGGAGLGGFLTPTGIGTLMEEGRKKVTVDEKDYLFELPLRADIAFIKGFRADSLGNVQYRRIAANTNQVIATAADYTIAEVNEIVEVGDIDPERVGTPSVFVNAVVQGYTFEAQQQVFEKLWAAGGILR